MIWHAKKPHGYAVIMVFRDRSVLASTYSYALCRELPSAQTGLTAEFGMGSGVSLSLKTPGRNDHVDKKNQLLKTHYVGGLNTHLVAHEQYPLQNV